MFAGIRFAAFGRVQEKPSAPHSRLVCNHLQHLLKPSIGAAQKKSNSTAPRIKTKNRKK
jgi:hypothetical protein